MGCTDNMWFAFLTAIDDEQMYGINTYRLQDCDHVVRKDGHNQDRAWSWVKCPTIYILNGNSKERERKSCKGEDPDKDKNHKAKSMWSYSSIAQHMIWNNQIIQNRNSTTLKKHTERAAKANYSFIRAARNIMDTMCTVKWYLVMDNGQKMAPLQDSPYWKCACTFQFGEDQRTLISYYIHFSIINLGYNCHCARWVVHNDPRLG